MGNYEKARAIWWVGIGLDVIIIISSLIFLPGCMIVPAQYRTDEQGRQVMTQPERIVPAPITVNTYPALPVVYTEPVVYGYSPVVYRPYWEPVYYGTYYPSPVVYQRSYVVSRPVYYGRTVYVGGGRGHHRRY